MIRVPDHKPEILSPEDQAAVVEEIPFPRRGAFLAALHGVRPGELRALDLKDYVHRNGRAGLDVHRAVKGPNATAKIGPTKTGEAKWIPIGNELDSWIAWRVQQRRNALANPDERGVEHWRSPALFPNPTSRKPGRRWISNALREEWRRAAARAGVDAKMYEGTKHSAATSWLSSGMPMEFVQRMLRHRDRKSTERYGKLTDAALVASFESVQDQPRSERGRDSGAESA